MLASTSRQKSIRLAVHPLDSRELPSATMLNLASRGAEVEAAGAILRQTHGHDQAHSFLRVQGHGTEQGYNTDARPLEFDAKAGSATRSLTLGQIPVVREDGVAYREFVLNVNQHFFAPHLALNDLRLYVSPSRTLHGYDAGTKRLGGQAPVFDLDAGGDVSVRMTGRLNFWGRGWDVRVLVPDAAFAGQASTSRVYLFSKFAGGNGGYEEWAVRKVAKPPTLGSLSGSVFIDTNGDGTRTATSAGFNEEPGIEGVTITLRGTNDLGESVERTTITAADGSYSFADLRPGMYSLSETQPGDLLDGDESLGSLGGTVGSDEFTNIDLTGTTRRGTGYNFGELEESVNHS